MNYCSGCKHWRWLCEIEEGKFVCNRGKRIKLNTKACKQFRYTDSVYRWSVVKLYSKFETGNYKYE